MKSCTTVTAVDDKYAPQLLVSCHTWRRFRPWMWENPLLLICDGNMSLATIDQCVAALNHPRMRVVMWNDRDHYNGQRHKMLAAYVHLPPREVNTRWWMKIDTDAIATGPEPGFDESWFTLEDGSRPAFVAPGWGYTKPEDQMEKLDAWGNGIRDLRGTQPLKLPYEKGSGKCRHKRMCSWLSFYSTSWSATAASYLHDWRLPVPSQDGYHWYVAARRGDSWRRVAMKKKGWTNVSRYRKLVERVKEVLGEE